MSLLIYIAGAETVMKYINWLSLVALFSTFGSALAFADLTKEEEHYARAMILSHLSSLSFPKTSDEYEKLKSEMAHEILSYMRPDGYSSDQDYQTVMEMTESRDTYIHLTKNSQDEKTRYDAYAVLLSESVFNTSYYETPFSNEDMALLKQALDDSSPLVQKQAEDYEDRLHLRDPSIVRIEILAGLKSEDFDVWYSAHNHRDKWVFYPKSEKKFRDAYMDRAQKASDEKIRYYSYEFLLSGRVYHSSDKNPLSNVDKALLKQALNDPSLSVQKLGQDLLGELNYINDVIKKIRAHDPNGKGRNSMDPTETVYANGCSPKFL
jgi:hypothetical protein